MAAIALFALPLSAMAACVDGSQSVESRCAVEATEETCALVLGSGGEISLCEWTGSTCQTNGLYLCSDLGPQNCVEAVSSLGMCAWQPTQTSIAQAVDGLKDAGGTVFGVFFGLLSKVIMYIVGIVVVLWAIRRFMQEFKNK